MVQPYYDDGQITIYCGKAEEVLPTLSEDSVDLVFTSPPYNLGNTSGGGCTTGSRMVKLKAGYIDHADAMPHTDYVAWQHDVLRQCWRTLSDTGAIFYNHKPRVQDGIARLPLELNPGLPLRQVIIWDRGSGVNMSASFFTPAHEWIMLMAKPAFRVDKGMSATFGDVWRIMPEVNSEHPAPFPLQLPLRAIAATTAKAILDPFSGSGTTLRAAKNCGRRAIGIEKSERYCEIAVRRLQQSVLPLDAA